MRAARFHSKGDIRIEEICSPTDDVRPGSVLVEVEWCGICGSDLHVYKAGSPISTLPLTLGHEFCGVVKQVPVGSKFTVGDKVIVDPTLTCQNCVPCSHGWESQCPGLSFLGLPGGPDGGLGELVTVNEYKLHKLPGNIALGDAALAEPLAVGLHAVRSAHVNSQEWGQKTILLFGAGPVGYAVLENLLAHGACPENIFVSEPSKRKQRLLKAIGVRLLVSKETGVEGQCLDLTQCMGADIAFICVGVPQAVGTAMSALRPRGTCINVAFWGSKIELPFVDFFKKEIDFRSSMAYSSEDFRDTVDMMALGKYRRLAEMVTARVLLDDVVKHGFEELLKSTDSHLKILVTPKRSNLLDRDILATT
ncbi:chaperonin 10-like protein [Aspergillus carlsbadensis]|nr:chaperonin 10-like protein [Aspergillus carlsbadensis]